MKKLRYFINLTVAVILVGGAAVCAALLVAARPEAPRATHSKGVPEVQAVAMTPRPFDEPIVGYGTIRAKNQVKIVPQVSGMLTLMHEDMAVGKVISEGDVIFEIDRQSYESQVQQVEADIRMMETQLKRHEKDREYLTSRLANAKEQVELAKKAVEREEELQAKNATRDVAVEAARQNYLVHQATIIDLENKLELIPSMIDETNARLESRRSQLADAKRNLDSTRIVSPFDARVESVTVSESQFVIANFAIAVLTDMRAFELSAVLDPSDLQWTHPLAIARTRGDDRGEPPAVTIAWTMHGRRYTWSGHISHMERHDEATRTARLVVEIPNEPIELSADEMAGGQLLSIGMFCSAEIPAEKLDGALVVPRSAIHEDNVVYTFQPDEGSDGRAGTLVERRVPILRTVGNQVLVDFAGRSEHVRLAAADSATECELQPGEFVILSPVSRPVAGMKLRLRDEAVAALTASELLALWQQPERTVAIPSPKTLPVHLPVAFLAP